MVDDDKKKASLQVGHAQLGDFRLMGLKLHLA